MTLDSTNNPISRRNFLALSATGMAAAMGPSWLGSIAMAAGNRKPAKACILLWMSGGPCQLDTFDPKPDAASEIRGPYAPIKTSVPGLHITELFPQMAKQMHRGAVIRSMSTPEVDHRRASYLMHTGFRKGGPLVHPVFGSVAARELGDPAAALPNYVGMELKEASSAGFLGAGDEPLRMQSDGTIRHAQSTLPATQLSSRVALLNALNDDFAASHGSSKAAEAHHTTQERALRIMDPKHRVAFDDTREPDDVREMYGKTGIGRSCLRARRLVEAGVPFVEVSHGDWDLHGGAYIDAGVGKVAHPCDQATAALLADLHQRGMLDDTLVIWTGEFGRTPKINGDSGRDHFAAAWSSAMFGAGIQGGAVVGRTDDTAAEVRDRPVNATDFLATVYTILGIDTETMIPGPGGRPVNILDVQNVDPNPLTEIL